MTRSATVKSHLRDNLSPPSTILGRLRIAIGDRLQKDVAERAGVSVKTIQRYLAGEGLKAPVLRAIAAACDVSADWLLGETQVTIGDAASASVDLLATGRGLTEANLDETNPEAKSQYRFLSDTGKSRYVTIPRFNVAASAGGGALAEHAQVVEYLAFDVNFVRSRLRRDPKHLVLIEARGDSMEPTIRDGDILTVDLTPDQALSHAHLYVLRVDNELLVKRLERRLDGAMVVSSDNARYHSETVLRDQLDTLHILGEVLLVSAPPR